MTVADGTSRDLLSSWRSVADPTRPLVGLALLFATVGAAIPLGLMIHGALVKDLTYATWTWLAIPAVWIACLVASWLATRQRSLGSLLLSAAAGAGAWAFEQEYGLYTFGAVWLIAIALYLAGSLNRPTKAP
ncbi:MAG: hypothetical protein O6913_08795 [Chloroflexi bacterium]|nr:hypothetical protein [Chloroflexota bacterium]MCZ6706703.1 hypothetical protein [Chloroflexota bacterium]